MKECYNQQVDLKWFIDGLSFRKIRELKRLCEQEENEVNEVIAKQKSQNVEIPIDK